MARPPHSHQQHLGEVAHRRALAGLAGALRTVADLRRSTLPLAAGRTWDRVLAHAQTRLDAVGEVVWEVSVDSSTARAHQHASGARRRPSRADEKRGSSTRPTRGSDVAEED